MKALRTGAKSTKGRKWILLYSEICKTRSKAMSREWHIKRDRQFRAKLRSPIANPRPDQTLAADDGGAYATMQRVKLLRAARSDFRC